MTRSMFLIPLLAATLGACSAHAGEGAPETEPAYDGGACGAPEALGYCAVVTPKLYPVAAECNRPCERAFDCSVEPDHSECRGIGSTGTSGLYCCAAVKP